MSATDADLQPPREGALTSPAAQTLLTQLLRAEQQREAADGNAQARAIVGQQQQQPEARERPQLTFRLGDEMSDEALGASGRPVLSVTPSGELFTSDELDREHRASYSIPVRAVPPAPALDATRMSVLLLPLMTTEQNRTEEQNTR